jgi:hypothetical protein
MRLLLLIIHFIGLAMAVGSGFANLFLGRVAAKLEPAERGSFMSKISVLGRMGQTGLALLILSGVMLATPYWKALGEMPFFAAKLGLVVVLLLSVSRVLYLLSKAKKENNPALMAKIKPLGMLNFIIGLTIIVLAVLAFR